MSCERLGLLKLCCPNPPAPIPLRCPLKPALLPNPRLLRSPLPKLPALAPARPPPEPRPSEPPKLCLLPANPLPPSPPDRCPAAPPPNPPKLWPVPPPLNPPKLRPDPPPPKLRPPPPKPPPPLKLRPPPPKPPPRPPPPKPRPQLSAKGSQNIKLVVSAVRKSFRLMVVPRCWCVSVSKPGRFTEWLVGVSALLHQCRAAPHLPQSAGPIARHRRPRPAA